MHETKDARTAQTVALLKTISPAECTSVKAAMKTVIVALALHVFFALPPGVLAYPARRASP